jgi:hypothetical protein
MMNINKTKYTEIGRKIREIPPEMSGTSYEWEELVEKMCDSNDSGLHDIGIKELCELKKKRYANKKSRADGTIKL